MIVKTSFSTGHVQSSLNYIGRNGALEKGKPAIFDREGNMLSREDLLPIRQEIDGYDMNRRYIFSPADAEYTKEEISIAVRDSLEQYQVQTERNFDYVFAIHDHNGRTHAHVIAYGDTESLHMDKYDLGLLRETALELEMENTKSIKVGYENEKDIFIESEKEYSIGD